MCRVIQAIVSLSMLFLSLGGDDASLLARGCDAIDNNNNSTKNRSSLQVLCD